MDFDDKYLIFTLAAVMIMISFAMVMQGCTTTHHEPECKCKCTEVDATFECGGIHYSQELEIK